MMLQLVKVCVNECMAMGTAKRSGPAGETVRSVWLALTLVVGASLSAAGPAWAQDPPPPGDGWTVVKEWTGEAGEQKTELFKPPDRPWRVSYKTTSGTPMGILHVILRSEDDRWIRGAVGLQANEQGVTAGSFMVNSEVEDYRLEIRSFGLNWHVLVEQQP
jgi:hypothetical protein